jgi:quercetin dioxygenase-like cupin family protein
VPNKRLHPTGALDHRDEYSWIRAAVAGEPHGVNEPHYHPTDEEITVLSGTLYFGQGMTMQPDDAMALPAGSFVAQPATTWHFLLTKAESVELEIRGIGPRSNLVAK